MGKLTAEQIAAKWEADQAARELREALTPDAGRVGFPIGTRIRFTKRLDCEATGDHPALVYAEAGELGEITGHGTPEGYWAKTDHWPNRFGVSRNEFEPVHEAPRPEVDGEQYAKEQAEIEKEHTTDAQE